MAINGAFNNVTGDLYQNPINASLSGAFKTAHDPNELLEALAGNYYIAALMKGDDDTAFNGLRVNMSGRNEGMTTTLMLRRFLDQLFIDATIDALDQARENLAEAQALTEQMAVDLLGKEGKMRADETREEYLKRVGKSIDEKYENGDISEEEYQAWQERRANEELAQARVDALENRLRQDYENQKIVMERLDKRLVELSDVEQELTAIKKLEDPEVIDARIAILAVNYPNLRIVYNEAGEPDLDATVKAVKGEAIETSRQVEEVTSSMNEIESQIEINVATSESEDLAQNNELDNADVLKYAQVYVSDNNHNEVTEPLKEDAIQLTTALSSNSLFSSNL